MSSAQVFTVKKPSGNDFGYLAKVNKAAELMLLETDIKITLEATDNAYTEKQRGSLHVWCGQCAKVLNDAGIECEVVHPFTRQTISMPWTMNLFKENIYKFVLNAMTGLNSTEDQNTVNPSEVALVISKRYAENGLVCPPWPSLR